MKRKLVIRVVVVMLVLSALYPLYKGLSATMQARHASSPGTTLDDGLVGHWTFDGADMTSSTALDKSGNNNTGTLTNMSTSSRVAGVLGQGLQLDGTDDYVDLGVHSSEQTLYSVSLWYKSESNSDAQTVFMRGVGNGCFYNPHIIASADGQSLIVSESGCSSGGLVGTYPIVLGAWNHVVVTRSGSQVKVYLNGVLLTTDNSQDSPLSTADARVLLGSFLNVFPTTHLLPMKGSLDDLRIYNRVLSADEIHQLYKMGEGTTMDVDPTSDPLAEGLAGYWRFDEASGVTAIDSSVNGKNGTLTSGPTWGVGKVGGAVTFDGGDDYINIPTNISALDSASAFSISVWFKRTGTGGTSGTALFAKGATSAFTNDIDLMLDNGNLLFAQINNGADGTASFDYSSQYTLGTWALVTLVYDGTQTGNSNRLKIYFNGSQQTLSFGAYSVPATTANLAGTNQYIGRYIDPSNDWMMKGDIDETRIYNRALSADEVATLYRTTKPTEVDASLVGHWTFDGPTISGTTVRDLSGAGNNGTLTNGPTKTEGVLGQAMTFASGQTMLISGDIAFSTGASISFWMKAPRFSNHHGIMDWGNDSYGSGTGTYIHYNNSADVKMYFVPNGWANGSISADVSDVTDNSIWSYWVLVADGSQLKLFKQGSLVTTSSYTSPDKALTAIASYDGGQMDFNGTLEDFRVYNRALSADEIYKMYKVGAGSTMNVDTVTPDLERGLAGYWPLDNGSGVTASDLSVNGNNGTLNNGPTWGSGKIGGAVVSDGVDDSISIPTGVNLAGNSFTVSAWAKRNTTGADDMFFTQGIAVGNYGLLLGFRSTNTFTCAFYANDLDTTATYTDSEWHLWTCTYDTITNRRSIYRDGALVTYATAPSDYLGSGNMYIAYSSTGHGSFEGSVDEVRVYSRALSADEVAQLYRTTVPTKASDGLVGYWPFNGPDVTDKIYDRSGAGNNGYFVGGATTSAKTIGQVGQGLQFDGVDDYVSIASSASIRPPLPLAFSFWINPATVASNQDIFGARVHEPHEGYWANITSDGSLQISFGDNVYCAPEGRRSKTTAASALVANQWQHIAGVIRGATDMDIYINGVDVGGTYSGSGGNISYVSSIMRLGSRGGADGCPAVYLNGALDEFRIYNRALSAQEVKQLYSAGR